MDEALRAVAQPTRRQILRLVRDRERAAGDIAARFDVSHAAVSQHLGVLKESGLLLERRDGRRRYYRADLRPLGEVRRWLDHMWDDALERLRVEAEADERRERRGRT